ncbi:MAG: PD-(D/E)XK nuclease domain-containing protein, partial [Bacteroidales bacterium]
RTDLTLLLPDCIYIIEFKVDCPQETALAQIESRRYYEKYQSEGKPIYLVGIQFDSEIRNIKEMVWRMV